MPVPPTRVSFGLAFFALFGLALGCSSSSLNPGGTGGAGTGGAGGSSAGGSGGTAGKCGDGGNAGDHFVQGGASCYRFGSSAATWDGAKTACEAWQGHLAVITSSEEQKYVVELMTDVVNSGQNIYYAWIGGRVDAPNTLSWVTGEAPSFTSWSANQPGGTGCVKADRGESWNWWVEPCDNANPTFICER